MYITSFNLKEKVCDVQLAKYLSGFKLLLEGLKSVDKPVCTVKYFLQLQNTNFYHEHFFLTFMSPKSFNVAVFSTFMCKFFFLECFFINSCFGTCWLSYFYCRKGRKCLEFFSMPHLYVNLAHTDVRKAHFLRIIEGALQTYKLNNIFVFLNAISCDKLQIVTQKLKTGQWSNSSCLAINITFWCEKPWI